ncbi:MarR family winged helix-turn-helix transcriptional regulator [Streptomyces abikoensis]
MTPAPDEVQDRELALWRQLTVLTSYVGNALDKRLMRSHGVSLSEFMALTVLAEAGPEGVRMQPLADATGLNSSTISRLVARLESSGLARRSLCEEDRRATYAHATDQGREVAAEARETFGKELGTALSVAAFDERMAPVVNVLRAEG